ncbi:hypothetical protein BJP40_28685 [Streptomyces sp. CC53]|uniref:SCO1860 family LAETG-anchored protein n=1 Tax=Streptomyces sp. C8S0 TaxID=2585716 RepID=UPI0008DD79EF|nr:SCO1860 family LAETG-anchored protein [Streptomyces sp. C8S0]OII62351.1 hypothetical protein BJP40_28685 [Streptomyces sp. CC53]
MGGSTTVYRTTATTRRRTPAAAAALALAALAAAPAAHATPPSPSPGQEGRAGAAVLRTALDVDLLDKTAQIPVRATLNEVEAPAAAEKTALTVRVDGVDRGRPVSLLRADAAQAEATADARRAEASVTLARARVHLPGLPLLSLVQAEKVTARAVCEAGARPVAEANLLGRVTVLGKRVTVTPGGRSTVRVPGVGEVVLDLSERTTTSTTAAATALRLKVAVNPLDLNVADVRGEVTLAEAHCTAPGGQGASPGPSTPADRPGQPATPADQAPAAPAGPDTADPSEPSAATGLRVQTEGAAPAPATEALAETGADSRAPYVVAGAAALLVAGATSLLVARRAAARGTRG